MFEQNQLGIATILGIASGSDAKDALKWFEEAAHKRLCTCTGEPRGHVFERVGHDPQQCRCAALAAGAAEQGYGRAYYNLGVMYMEGKGVKQDYVEAIHYFEKGAAAGDIRAQNNLGYLYDHGLGVKQDLPKAAEFYKQAADAGDPMGENNLADLLLRGDGVSKTMPRHSACSRKLRPRDIQAPA